ncbi:MAG: hypothetical protein ACRCWR_00930 [Saezia sp.]
MAKSGYPPKGETVLGAFKNGSKRVHSTFEIDHDGYLLIPIADGFMVSKALELFAWTRCPWPNIEGLTEQIASDMLDDDYVNIK